MSLATHRWIRPLRIAFLAAACAAAGLAQSPGTPPNPAAPPPAIEPRLGIVLPSRAAAATPALERVRDEFVVDGIRVELVVLPSAPTKTKRVPNAPRHVLVVEGADVEPTGATTEEYKMGGGQTRRIRWRGAVAKLTATLHDAAAAPVVLSEFVESGDWTRPPDSWVFPEGSGKVEIEVPTDEVLAYVLGRAVRRSLAFVAAEELWERRSGLVSHAAGLRGEEAAQFWERTAWIAAERAPRRAIAPWRTIEVAALALWEGAATRAAKFPRPETGCAWCGLAWSGDAEGDCTCPEARALSAAAFVLRGVTRRGGDLESREGAIAIEVEWDELLPARPPSAKSEVVRALGKRLVAEHEADRALLRARRIGERKPEFALEWYCVVTLRDDLTWEPADVDLVRHAAYGFQAFPIGFTNYSTYFDAKGPKPMQVVAQRRVGLEYTATEKREFKPEKLDQLEAQIWRVLRANATGKLPPR